MQSCFDFALIMSLYVPAGQFVAFGDPLVEYVPGSAFLQLILLARPFMVLKVPASQNIGRGDPIGQ